MQLFDCSGDAVKALQEVVFTVDFVAISPAGVVIVECDAAKFTDEYRLAPISISLRKSLVITAMIYTGVSPTDYAATQESDLDP